MGAKQNEIIFEDVTKQRFGQREEQDFSNMVLGLGHDGWFDILFVITLLKILGTLFSS